MRLVRLLALTRGPALVGFDFPFGYPHGSGLGGGRALAARLARLVIDDADGRNNRFAVAERLNRTFGAPGPFWGKPSAPRKPAFDSFRFSEHREAERFLHARGWRPMSVWQVAYAGSVGGQVLTGLPAIHRLVHHRALAGRTRIWPFETGWQRRLDGVVVAEIWPSLAMHGRMRHPIRDARQVVAMRDWLAAADRRGRIAKALAKPPGLTGRKAYICAREEGWIVAAHLAPNRRQRRRHNRASGLV